MIKVLGGVDGLISRHRLNDVAARALELASLRYDLEREVDDRRAAIRSVSEDLQEIAS